MANETPIKGKRLGRMPLKTTRKALQFSDFFRFVNLPKATNYWTKKTPLAKRTFGNDSVGNCVIGSTHVAAPFLLNGFRGRYVGPGVVLTCESGATLTITPNHPVFTDKGTVSAASLNVGDHVVRCLDSERMSRLLDQNLQHCPAQISDVFQSLAAVGVPSAVASSSNEGDLPRSDEFHGDGRCFISKVDVVGANGFLWSEIVAFAAQHLSHDALALASMESPLFARLSAQRLGLGSVDLAAAGITPSVQHAGLNVWRNRGARKTAGISRTSSHTESTESHIQRLHVDSNLRSQLTSGLTDDISVNDGLIYRDSPRGMGGFNVLASDRGRYLGAAYRGEFLSGSESEAAQLEPSGKASPVDAELVSQLRQRFPALITLDKVVEVRDVHISDHVYDLSTAQGWYTGNDILLHNCTRASQAYAIIRMERIEQKRTVSIDDDEVVRVYREMSKRLYGGGDNGAYEDDALNEWRNPETTIRDSYGKPYTIDAYLRINALNHDEVRAGIALSGGHGIKVCFNLPAAFQDLDRWDVPEGQALVGPWMPGSWGGHSMFGIDYDPVDFTTDDTWAHGPRKISWRAVAAYMDEAHLVIDSVDSWRKRTSGKTKSALADVVAAVNAASAIPIGVC